CDRNFLGFLRMREWRELHRQLKLQCAELGWREEGKRGSESLFAAPGSSGSPGRRAKSDSDSLFFPRGRNKREVHGASEGTAKEGQGGEPSTDVGSRNRPQKSLGSRVSGNDDFKNAAASEADANRDTHAYVRLHRALLAGLPTQ